MVELKKDFTRLDAICKCVSVGEHAAELELTILRLLILRFVNWFKTAAVSLCCVKHEEQGIACILARVRDCDIKLTLSLTKISALLNSLDLYLSF